MCQIKIWWHGKGSNIKNIKEWILENNYKTAHHTIGINKEGIFTNYRTHKIVDSIK